jgi:uncharacterized membrane protein
MAYLFFKFLHVAAIAIWIGAQLAIGVLNNRVARHENRAARAPLVRQTVFLGKAVIGPSGAVALITGGIAMALGHVAMTGWIVWGLVVMVIAGVAGGMVAAPTARRLAQRLDAGAAEEELDALQRRLAIIGTVNLVLLLTAIGAMVFKP